MSIKLNHTIVDAEDKAVSALFLTEMLGLRWIISMSMAISPSQHYAFLVSENEFDQIFERIRDINTWDDGDLISWPMALEEIKKTRLIRGMGTKD